MNQTIPCLPLSFLESMLPELPAEDTLRDYETWWEEEGKGISEATERAGTPWLRMFDRFGDRVDEILLSASYRKMVQRGYEEGILWRVFEEKSLFSSYLLGYVASFYDPGLYCPYTVSLSTVVPLEKYGTDSVTMNCLGGFAAGKLPAYPCLGFMQILNDGGQGVCEAMPDDTLSMLMARILTGRPGFVSDPALDTSKNQVVYAHCVGTTKVFGPEGKANDYRIRTLHNRDPRGARVGNHSRLDALPSRVAVKRGGCFVFDPQRTGKRNVI